MSFLSIPWALGRLWDILDIPVTVISVTDINGVMKTDDTFLRWKP